MRTLADLTEQRKHMLAATAYVDYVRMLARRERLEDLPDGEPYRKLKAAVGTTDDAALRAVSAEFVRLIEQQTVLGAMAGGWTPAPPFVPLVALELDPTGTFVPDGNPIPATTLPITSLTTASAKLATIFSFDTRTLATLDPRGRRLFEAAFVHWLRVLEDREFLSATPAIVGERPAGILAGVTAIGTGSLPDDLAVLYAAVSGGAAVAPYYICAPGTAQSLAGLEPPIRVSDSGGLAIGLVPVITSPAAGNKIILIDAGRLVVVDDLLDVSRSDVAAVEMDDAPVGGALVSGWQTNTTFVRAIRYLWWALTTADAVAYTEIASGS